MSPSGSPSDHSNSYTFLQNPPSTTGATASCSSSGSGIESAHSHAQRSYPFLSVKRSVIKSESIESLSSLKEARLSSIEHCEAVICNDPGMNAVAAHPHLGLFVVFCVSRSLLEEGAIEIPTQPKTAVSTLEEQNSKPAFKVQDKQSLPCKVFASDFYNLQGLFKLTSDTVYLHTNLVNTPKNRQRIADHIESVSKKVLEEVGKLTGKVPAEKLIASALFKIQLKVYWKILRLDRIRGLQSGLLTSMSKVSKKSFIGQSFRANSKLQPEKFRATSLSSQELRECTKLVDLEHAEFHALLRLRYHYVTNNQSRWVALHKVADEQVLQNQTDNFVQHSKLYQSDIGSSNLGFV